MSSGGSRIRPTSSLLRKVIFDTIRPDIGEASFLDLFAGTGSVGLESLAEGAAHCVLVERDRPTFKAGATGSQAPPRLELSGEDSRRYGAAFCPPGLAAAI